jgi:hypothetical protein
METLSAPYGPDSPIPIAIATIGIGNIAMGITTKYSPLTILHVPDGLWTIGHGLSSIFYGLSTMVYGLSAIYQNQQPTPAPLSKKTKG